MQAFEKKEASLLFDGFKLIDLHLLSMHLLKYSIKYYKYRYFSVPPEFFQTTDNDGLTSVLCFYFDSMSLGS